MAINALGQVNMSGGTPVRNTENERRGSMVFECHSRQATPEELEHYFGDKPKRQEQAKPVSPTVEVPEETLESRRMKSLNRLLAAARKVDKKQYKAMKAAVMIIEKLNGWDKEAD